MSKRIFILGANGFIGCHLTQAILEQTDWLVVGLDLHTHKLGELLDHPRMTFKQADMCASMDWIEAEIQKADVVLPLVAIATPETYVSDPLRVFELDFEANLPIVRLCVKHQTRLVFPSTSEVYGMCNDQVFDEATSNTVLGPTSAPRWIYASCKQLMDRLIKAYGDKGELQYTLFRPFNWFGAKLDDLRADAPVKSRVLTQFLKQIIQGAPITLVDGGEQRRSFTYIDDGIAALLAILRNENGCADQQIFNLGNPENDISIKDLAKTLLAVSQSFPALKPYAEKVTLKQEDSQHFYGQGYQDIAHRLPSIDWAAEKLGWTPQMSLEKGLSAMLQSELHGDLGKILENRIKTMA